VTERACNDGLAGSTAATRRWFRACGYWVSSTAPHLGLRCQNQAPSTLHQVALTKRHRDYAELGRHARRLLSPMRCHYASIQPLSCQRRWQLPATQA